MHSITPQLFTKQAEILGRNLEIRNEASVLDGELHSAGEVYDLAARALSLARKSGQWDQIFWSEIFLGSLETDRGNYQNAIEAMRAARSSASRANAPYFVAKASLDLAGVLVDVGGWQEALTLATESLPTFKQYGDKNSQRAAYVTLMDVYGGKESDLRDFDKAIEDYSQAKALLEPSDPSSAASLASALFEIHFQQGFYADENPADAEQPLAYFKGQDDELGEAHSLLSLAEAERSAGDLNASTQAITAAQPLVKRVANFYLSGRFYLWASKPVQKPGQINRCSDPV